LEQAGFKTLTALNGELGVELAKAHIPDLILMDLVMPGINGFQATRIIRRDEITKDIPIVIISGNEQASEKFWGTRIGASGFLPKPITREELFKSIDELLQLNTLTKS
jgi:twitching motility two-component system response regulator PilH